MRRTELLKKIATAAKDAGVEFDLVTEGKKHSKFECGGEPVTVPRHNEINEYTAEGILKGLDKVFGEGWWRK